MATDTTPQPFQGFTPDITNGGLSPLQLALANFLATGFNINDSPIGVNTEFRYAMYDFADSRMVTPTPYDYLNRNAPIVRGSITGISYIIEPDGYIYMLRKAEDCGPNENRQEKVQLGPRSLAEGTFAYWGSVIRGGSMCVGGGGPYGTGGLTSAYPKSANSPGNPFTGVDLVPIGSFAVDEDASFIGSPPNVQLIGNYAGRGGIA